MSAHTRLCRSRRRCACCEALDYRVVLASPAVVVDLLAVYTPGAAAQVGGGLIFDH